jgi:5-methylcytosine-specific restriction endonuclease McrA
MTAAQRMARLLLYGPVCVYCGKTCRMDVPRHHPDKLTEEHLIPLSRGGPDCGANLRVACQACNRRKGSQSAREFAPERF